MSDLVSVIMPVYNGQKYLAEAISSILHQSYENWELIIIDDGSTDDSLQVAKEFGDPRLRILVNEQNRGVAFSLNRAIRESRGEYVARMDSDDIARPERLKVQVEFLKNNPSISIVGSAIQCFGEIENLYLYPENHAECLVDLLFKPCFAHPAVMWRKEDLVEHSLWYQEEPPTAEDYDLWERASHFVKFANIKEVLLDYRVDPQIKVSNYLRQQDVGHRDVKSRLLSRLGWSVTDDCLDQYITLTGGPSDRKYSLSEMVDLVAAALGANDKKCVFDSKSLKVRLRDSLYGYALRHRIKGIDWLKQKQPFWQGCKLFLKNG